jgi:hypothetical protein
MFHDPVKLRPARYVYVVEDSKGNSTRCADFEQAKLLAMKKQASAIARRYQPCDDTWHMVKSWYHCNFKRIKIPTAKVLKTAPPAAPIKTAPSVAVLPKACYDQHHAPMPRLAPPVLPSKPLVKHLLIDQPGVGYYLVTPAGIPFNSWLFMSVSAAIAYAQQKGYTVE